MLGASLPLFLPRLPSPAGRGRGPCGCGCAYSVTRIQESKRDRHNPWHNLIRDFERGLPSSSRHTRHNTYPCVSVANTPSSLPHTGPSVRSAQRGPILTSGPPSAQKLADPSHPAARAPLALQPWRDHSRTRPLCTMLYGPAQDPPARKGVRSQIQQFSATTLAITENAKCLPRGARSPCELPTSSST